jgi:predicted transcriptional regulator
MKSSGAMTKTMISARIPEKLSQELELIAESTQRSKAFLVTEALEELVERHVRLRKAIAQAEREADESGAYISHDKMTAWMESLGTENELPPPEPDVFRKAQ